MKSLNKTLDIIDAVSKVGSAGIRDISSVTGFPPTTVHRIAATLVKRQYFSQDPVTKNYSLSLRFLELGHQSSAAIRSSLPSHGRISRNLCLKPGKVPTWPFGMEDNVVYLDQVQSNKSMLKIFTQLGTRVPLYSTGVGKMLLSRWSETELDSYLKRTQLTPHTPNTLVSRSKILKELEQISTRGFSVDNEEMEAGVRCVAALVFDHRQHVVAAISISGAAMRITPERIEELGKKVKQCALDISRDLGF